MRFLKISDENKIMKNNQSRIMKILIFCVKNDGKIIKTNANNEKLKTNNHNTVH